MEPEPFEVEVEVTRAEDGTLGVDLGDDGTGRPGVAAVRPNGPCELAGVVVGDVLLGIDGERCQTVANVVEELRKNAAASLKLKLLRAPPPVRTKQWSASSLRVAPGACLDIPLVVEEPCICTFTLTVSGKGVIDFALLATLDGPASPPTVLSQRSESGDISGSATIGAACVVSAQLDNSAAYVSSVTLACTVTLTPMRQCVSAEAAMVDAELRAQDAHLASLDEHAAALATQETELRRMLEEAQVSLQAIAIMRAQDERARLELVQASAALGATLPLLQQTDSNAAERTALRRASQDAEEAVRAASACRRAAVQARQSLGPRGAGAKVEARQLREFAASAEAAMRRADELRALRTWVGIERWTIAPRPMRSCLASDINPHARMRRVCAVPMEEVASAFTTLAQSCGATLGAPPEIDAVRMHAWALARFRAPLPARTERATCAQRATAPREGTACHGTEQRRHRPQAPLAILTSSLWELRLRRWHPSRALAGLPHFERDASRPQMCAPRAALPRRGRRPPRPRRLLLAARRAHRADPAVGSRAVSR